MITDAMLANFPIPAEALEGMRAQGFRANNLGDGIDMFMAHDKGVGYSFGTITEYNPTKSKKLGYAFYDTIEICTWVIDKRESHVERVRFLPDELLSFNSEGEPVSGKYLDSYLAFKKGLKTPGTPLAKWGVLDDSLVASLKHDGIFSVEQFAAVPKSKIEGKYPIEVLEAYEQAGFFVAGKEQRSKNDETAAELLRLKDEAAKKDEAILTLQKQMAALMNKITQTTLVKQELEAEDHAKRGPGRPKKTVEMVGEE